MRPQAGPAPPTRARPLEGRTCLVTGAASGIGAAVAEAFGAAGAAVVLDHLPGEEAAAGRLVSRIRDGGGQALAVAGDVSDEADVEALVGAAEEAWGGLDILVANAGVQRDAPFAEMTLAQWRAVLDVDLTGAFLCARAAVRRFRRRPRDAGRCGGTIVFISSVHDAIPWAGHANYAAAKGGVRMLMESLAQEVAPEGIRVNAIAPGAVRTAINRAAWSDPAALERLLALIPYGRIGEPDDIARAAVWLASDASDYVVGTTLYVDGGMRLYPAFAHGG